MWDRENWDEICEHALMGVVLALVTVGVVAFGGMRTSEFALLAGLAALALAIWMARLWLDPEKRLLLHPMIWPALAFVGYAAWQSTLVGAPYPARRELLLLAVVATVFLVALNNLYRQEPIQWATHALVALGGLVASYAVIQWVSGSTKILWLAQPAQYVKRAGGPFFNPNHLAGFLTLLLPLALAQVFVGRGKAVMKILHGYAALIMLGGVAVSMSRGGWAATAVAMVTLFAWLGWRRRELRIPVAVAVALLVAGGYFFLTNSEKARARVDNVATDGNTDYAGRWHLWQPVVSMWRDQPWYGVGPAQFDVRFPRYRTPNVQASPVWVHNEYLNLLVDYGVAGTALVALTLGIFGWGVVRSSKFVERGLGDLGTRSSNRTAFFLGGWVGLLGLAIHCVVDFDLHIPGIAVTATLVVALLASNLRFATERFWFTPGLVGRLLLTIGMAGALCWMVPATVQFGREGLALNRIQRGPEVSAELLAGLELAALQSPDNYRTAFELGDNLRRLSLHGEGEWRKHAESALTWLDRAARANPYNARIELARGQTYAWLSQPEAANAAFQRALELGPNDVTIYNNVAWYLLKQGQPAKAKAMADESIRWQWWSNDLARQLLVESDAALRAKAGAP